jgi:hypothetical protein
MNRRTLLVTISVAANVVLLGAFALRPAATTALFRDVFRSGSAPGNSAADSRRASAEAAQSAATSRAMGEAAAWPEFQSGDFAGLVARLRAAGFPPTIVRTVIFAAVSEHYAARRRELQPRPGISTEYWKNSRQNQVFDPKAQAAMRELSREQNNLIKELLGADYNRNPNDEWFIADQRRRFGDLPAAKVEQLQKIQTDYNELIQKVREDGMGIMLAEDRAKLALLEREQRADMEKLFTPEELLDYDLRNSRAANNVRNKIGRFDATEDEFRALYVAQKAFDDQHPTSEFGPTNVEMMRQRNAAQETLDAQFKATLGDERYAEFQKANSPGRQNGNEELLGRLVSRLNLPPAATASVLAVQTDIQERVAALRTNRTLPPDQRTAQLNALATEATTKLTDTLGANGLEAYKQYGGQWLQQLTPPARPVIPPRQ